MEGEAASGILLVLGVRCLGLCCPEAASRLPIVLGKKVFFFFFFFFFFFLFLPLFFFFLFSGLPAWGDRAPATLNSALTPPTLIA